MSKRMGETVINGRVRGPLCMRRFDDTEIG